MVVPSRIYAWCNPQYWTRSERRCIGSFECGYDMEFHCFPCRTYAHYRILLFDWRLHLPNLWRNSYVYTACRVLQYGRLRYAGLSYVSESVGSEELQAVRMQITREVRNQEERDMRRYICKTFCWLQGRKLKVFDSCVYVRRSADSGDEALNMV